MPNRISQDRELNEIGDKILVALRLTDAEIEQIVSSPTAFSNVRAAIDRRRAGEAAAASGRTWSFGWRPVTAFAAFAAVVSLAIAEGAMRDAATAGIAAAPVAVTERALRTAMEAQVSPATAIPVRQAESRPGKVRSPRPVAVKRAGKREAVEEQDDIIEFQALTYTGDEEPERVQIIRVKLPRASLFAMGVKVPVENVSSELRAELLIGADGVMQAVRLVEGD